jgi:hypothetical protein
MNTAQPKTSFASKDLGSKILSGWKKSAENKEPFRFWINVRLTRVIEELINIAAERTGLKVEYRDQPGEISDMTDEEAAEARRVGYNASGLRSTHGSIWISGQGKDARPFWAELQRLSVMVKTPLDEPIMDDDEPVHQGYMYVADGKPRIFIDGLNMTVGRWKTLGGGLSVKEVRRCDLTGRKLRLPLKQSHVGTFGSSAKLVPATDTGGGATGLPNRWDTSGHTIRQAKRRPRTSNKIKKVK